MDNKYTDNIYPNNINKYFIKSSERNIIVSLRQKADNTCRNLINPDYIHKSFNRFKKGFYYKDNNDELLGFVLWKETQYIQERKYNIQKDDIIIKQLHIILICADYNDFRLGKKILFDIDSYCIDNQIPIITLEAATDKLIKYYEDSGYKRLGNVTREMRKEVKIFILDNKNSKKTTRKIKRVTPFSFLNTDTNGNITTRVII